MMEGQKLVSIEASMPMPWSRTSRGHSIRPAGVHFDRVAWRCISTRLVTGWKDLCQAGGVARNAQSFGRNSRMPSAGARSMSGEAVSSARVITAEISSGAVAARVLRRDPETSSRSRPGGHVAYWRCITSCSCDQTPRSFNRSRAVLMGASGLRNSWPSIAMKSSLERSPSRRAPLACSSDLLPIQSLSDGRAASASRRRLHQRRRLGFRIGRRQFSVRRRQGGLCGQRRLHNVASEQITCESFPETSPPRNNIASPPSAHPTARTCALSVAKGPARWTPSARLRESNSRHSLPPGASCATRRREHRIRNRIVCRKTIRS